MAVLKLGICDFKITIFIRRKFWNNRFLLIKILHQFPENSVSSWNIFSLLLSRWRSVYLLHRMQSFVSYIICSVPNSIWDIFSFQFSCMTGFSAFWCEANYRCKRKCLISNLEWKSFIKLSVKCGLIRRRKIVTTTLVLSNWCWSHEQFKQLKFALNQIQSVLVLEFDRDWDSLFFCCEKPPNSKSVWQTP